MLYLKHFGLHEAPFSLTPDTSFFFAHGPYQQALNTLLVALRSGEGFIKITGEVGTGKTMLCRKLLNSLESRFYTAYIPNPYLTPTALNYALADELGLQLSANMGTHAVLKTITQRLIEMHHEGRDVVLCIDEAQAMPDESIEALRLLTNLETEKRKLLQVVLFGQPELDERLAQPSLRQLRQRISFSYTLPTIDIPGLHAYIFHRLRVAGERGQVQFEPRALHRLAEASRGVPRLVNILAHKAMLAGYGQGAHTITDAHVQAAVADTEDTRAVVAHHRRGLVAGLLLITTLGISLAYLLLQRGGLV